MRISLVLTLLDYKRIPDYLSSLLIAQKEGIIGFRKKIHGMITIPECVILYNLAKSLPKNSKALEIGSYGGLSSAYLLAGLKKRNSFLYSIDPFDTDIQMQLEIVKKYENEDYRNAECESLNIKPSKHNVEKTLHKLNFNNFKLIEGYSGNVVKKWKRRINLLFIDGNHEYISVLKDYVNWSKHLKKGGVIIFHDANNLNYNKNWKWGLEGPTKVVSKHIYPPKWVNIGRIDSIVYATKNY